MTWTAPEINRPGGSLVAPEAELVRGLLDWHRSTLLVKCAGLTGEELARAPIAVSNLTLLGLVRHLSKVERVWFRRRVGREDVELLYSTDESPDADFIDIDPARAEADYARLVEEQHLARLAAADTSLDETFINPRDGEEWSVRMVFIHMIGEYARHNGHADLIRQALDGVTGS